MLLGERRAAEAAARARFYLARFRKLGFADEEWLASLEAVARDPHAALADMSMTSAGIDVERLRTWRDACVARPLPKYEAVPLEAVDPENEIEMLAALRRRLSTMGVPAAEVRDLESDDERTQLPHHRGSPR